MWAAVSKEASGFEKIFAKRPGQTFCNRLFSSIHGEGRGASMDSGEIKNLNHHLLLNEDCRRVAELYCWKS